LHPSKLGFEDPKPSARQFLLNCALASAFNRADQELGPNLIAKVFADYDKDLGWRAAARCLELPQRSSVFMCLSGSSVCNGEDLLVFVGAILTRAGVLGSEPQQPVPLPPVWRGNGGRPHRLDFACLR
ncbi:hypothetical protein DFP72DRAFT_844588, partial [Ephemerocybe angulata]